MENSPVNTGEGAMSLEQEIADIERRLAEKKSVLEQRKDSVSFEQTLEEKELIHEIVGEKIQEKVPQFIPKAPSVQAPTSSSVSANNILDSLPDVLKNQVQKLVNITFQKNLGEAIKIVQDIGNAALIDAFHSVLVDEIYQYLINRGKIKKL